jgi:hypothetical protein
MVIEKKRPLEGIKRFFVKIGKRNLIIAASAVLIITAVAVNWAVFADDGNNGGYDGYDVSSGMNNLYEDAGNTNTEEDFFSATQVSRARARDEAI